jgi:predicted lipid carrier protein YhbT
VFWPVASVDGRVIRLLEIMSQRKSVDGDDFFFQRDRWR